MTEKIFRIGELAQLVECNTETIRFYEKQGLIAPALRGHNNYRYYTEQHYQRLKLIRNCRALDMSLDEIKALLYLIDHPQENCHEVSLLLKSHVEHISMRIAQLQQLQDQLQQAIVRCEHREKSDACLIVDQILAMEVKSDKQSHLG